MFKVKVVLNPKDYMRYRKVMKSELFRDDPVSVLMLGVSEAENQIALGEEIDRVVHDSMKPFDRLMSKIRKNMGGRA